MSLLDKTSSEGNKAFGVLSSTWLGYKPGYNTNELHILNSQGKKVDEKSTFLEVVSGLQSGENYIATGKTLG